MIFSGEGDITPQDLAKMPIEMAASYLNGAANEIHPDDMDAPKVGGYGLRAALENFMDCGLGVATGESHISELKEYALRIIAAARDEGIGSFDSDSGRAGELVGFVIGGMREILKVHSGLSGETLSFLGSERPPTVPPKLNKPLRS